MTAGRTSPTVWIVLAVVGAIAIGAAIMAMMAVGAGSRSGSQIDWAFVGLICGMIGLIWVAMGAPTIDLGDMRRATRGYYNGSWGDEL